METFDFDNSSRKVLKTSDDAFINYIDIGEGKPIIFLHGWGCSNRVWQRNIPPLSKKFRVIAMDFRGHGSSSKVLHGHTVPQYADDVRQLIECLELNNVNLFGWSMAVPILLAYYEQYENNHKLDKICFVDGTPAPFVDESWNYHRMKEKQGDVNMMNQEIFDYVNNPIEYLTPKVKSWFKNKNSDVTWVVNEVIKTPPWISYAIYTDFLHRNYIDTLKKIDIPSLSIVPTDSESKIATGQFISDNVEQGKIAKIDAGHLLFYEEYEKFNELIFSFLS